MARVAGPGGADPDSRPAVFVGANIAGFHNAGTEAALDLIRDLVEAPAGSPAAKLLATTTFYVAPALNPDAHDAIFGKLRVRRGGNDMKVDHDVDGLTGEDPPDDLNGDGMITRMRIPDPAGGWLADATDPRVLVKADAMEQRAGAYRIETEGKDDDGDGELNEDGTDGVWPDKNFPHAFPYSTPEAGPWSSYAPETKAVMDFLLGRRNVALAVVYGPANNLLAAPQSLGGGGDLGTQKFKVPARRPPSSSAWRRTRNTPSTRSGRSPRTSPSCARTTSPRSSSSSSSAPAPPPRWTPTIRPISTSSPRATRSA